MIYKDNTIVYPYTRDEQRTPGKRNEKCINCGFEWTHHFNWLCDKKINYPFNESRKGLFDTTPIDFRFLTQPMKDSIQNLTIPQIPPITIGLNKLNKQEKTNVADVSDWRQWRHNIPGECICGIPKNHCEYHK